MRDLQLSTPRNVVVVLAAIICISGLLFVPLITRAIGQAPCPCVLDPQAPNFCQNVSCQDNTAGHITTGTCTAPGICNGKTADGKGLGLDQVAKILGDLMSKLMQPKPPKPPSTPPPSTTPTTGSTGCTQTIVVNDVSALQGNPCATYVPSVSSQINGGNDLSGALESGQSLDLSSDILGNLNSNTNTNDSSDLSSAISGTSSTVLPQGVVSLVPSLPGVFGDIKVLISGATILADTRSDAQNTETSGFYGSDSFGGQPQGLVGQWCQTRPWTANFLSFIIPPAFFDGLCSSRGYQVGTPPPVQQSPSLQQTVVHTSSQSQSQSSASSTPIAPTVSSVPPKVDIWAVPAAVPLGARTTIFWNTRGVSNCTEQSPDGSFNQNSLSGGAATVPLTGATTFSISCDAPDGSHVTGYVVVNLSI